MLVLRRKAGEAIVLNGTITIHVLAVEGERVKLGINAPPEVVIVRSELLEGPSSSGPSSSHPGSSGSRESRPYISREREGQRAYHPQENGNGHSSGEMPVPGRIPGGGMYGGPVRYTTRSRTYDDRHTSSPVPSTDPRYR
jgi:carbon storage regulator